MHKWFIISRYYQVLHMGNYFILIQILCQIRGFGTSYNMKKFRIGKV